MDSCPGPFSPVPYLAQYAGTSNLTYDHPWSNCFSYGFLPGAYAYIAYTSGSASMASSASLALRSIPQARKNFKAYGGHLEWAGPYMRLAENEAWPLLFLYSKKDFLIPHSYMTRMVEFKKQQNPSRLVESKVFESAPTCSS